MAYRPSATGNYAQAGRAAANDAERSFDAARTFSPKSDEIVRHAAKLQAKENINMIKAEANLRKQAIGEKAKTAAQETRIDAKQELQGAKRKAGMLAAAGKFLGTGIGGLAPSDRKKREVGADSQALLEREEKARAQAEEYRNAAPPDFLTPSPTPSSASTGNDSSGNSPVVGGGDLSMRYMSKLTGAGMSDEQAAATVGHLLVETGGFKHMEELAPNRHGTRGYGHLQWTDPNPGSGRRTDFMNWSQQNNLDPQSFEANSGFLVHEMTTNFNQSWTGGGSFSGLQQQPTLEAASNYLQTNFIRPGVPHTDRRLAEGRNVLAQWQNRNKD